MYNEDFFNSIKIEGEEWRTFAKYYAVSSFGRIVSFRKGSPRLLSIVIQEARGKKYSHVCINQKKVRVHRIVANTFIPNPNGYKEIDHINGDGTDNHVNNLRWCDRAFNMRNPITQKRLRLSSHHRKGEKCLLDRKIAKLKNGRILAIYDSISDIKKEGYNDCCVYWACNGKYKTHAGFEWKYIFYSE